MIAIIDYGMGNLRSVQKAFEKVGAQAMITHTPADIHQAKRVVLPGVGAMAPAMQKLQELGLIESIRAVIQKEKPFLGICLGMQLLFDQSSEGGMTEGLKILRGRVERFSQGKVPHMGWNQIQMDAPGAPMFKGIHSGSDVYFCHSYYVNPADPSIAAAHTKYGMNYVSAVARGRLWAVQFHPEKSQKIGLQILENFARL